jgi:hypothetical protein
VTVLEPDHVRRAAVAASNLDDLPHPVSVSDVTAVHVQPVSDLGAHLTLTSCFTSNYYQVA